jgi:TctA family transporter
MAYGVMMGVVLGPLAQTSLRNALMSTGGDASVVIYSIGRKVRARKMQDV